VLKNGCPTPASPELRTIFYRLTNLLAIGILPLVVFDGPHRPARKRGVDISTVDHRFERDFTALVEAFGCEWRKAPGEAEAELALLSRQGLVDAVLTDDGDALLFGARVVIRNWSATLSGNAASSKARNAESDQSKTSELAAAAEEDKPSHVDVYHADAIEKVLGLDPAGHILIGTSLRSHLTP
jgi:Holliday junction resolvase YEN1